MEKTLEQRISTVQVLSSLVARMKLAGQMGGTTYNGKRDIWASLGYPKEIGYDDYWTAYKRQDIANAIIKRPIKVTWRGDLALLETKDSSETPLEKEYKELSKALKLKTVFSRLDKLTGLGRYGVLLMGFNDVSNIADFANEVSGVVQLLYVKPLGEKAAVIDKWVEDPKDPRYGKPLFYNITLTQSSDTSKTSRSIKVHYSRVIHVVDDADEDDNIGTPRLEAVYNRLKDLEKLVGGSAEMFWRGARPGYGGKLDKDYTLTADEEDALEQRLDEYEHDLRRILINEGIELKNLASQVSDPGGHVDIQLMMISAVTGIPKRILTGTERGELASTQDTEHWYSLIQERREEFAEPNIVRAFIDRMVELSILPEASEGYDIVWSDLFSISEKDKVEIGLTRARALKEYAGTAGTDTIIPPKAFAELFLGLTQEQMELVQQYIDEYMLEDEFEEETEEPIIETPEASPDEEV